MRKNTIKYIVLILIFVAILLATIMMGYIVVRGDVYDITKEVNFIPMTATAYCIDGTTASGSHTRRGIAASKPEWIGLTAMVYKNNHGMPGDFLGYYEIKDTGGENIRSGKVIDLWFPTYDECIQFGRKKVLVVLVKGVG